MDGEVWINYVGFIGICKQVRMFKNGHLVKIVQNGSKYDYSAQTTIQPHYVPNFTDSDDIIVRQSVLIHNLQLHWFQKSCLRDDELSRFPCDCFVSIVFGFGFVQKFAFKRKFEIRIGSSAPDGVLVGQVLSVEMNGCGVRHFKCC